MREALTFMYIVKASEVLRLVVMQTFFQRLR